MGEDLHYLRLSSWIGYLASVKMGCHIDLGVLYVSLFTILILLLFPIAWSGHLTFKMTTAGLSASTFKQAILILSPERGTWPTH
jgi:hypothetical protein